MAPRGRRGGGRGRARAGMDPGGRDRGRGRGRGRMSARSGGSGRDRGRLRNVPHALKSYDAATMPEEDDEMEVEREEEADDERKAAERDVADDEEDELEEYSRSYFLAKEAGAAGGSGSGSNARLAGRRVSDINPVDEQLLRTTMQSIAPKHEKEVMALVDSYKNLYGKWLFELRCGFGLLMYGFGSKKGLLEDFASTTLTDFTVLVVNGYLPSINFKQFIATIAELLWQQHKGKQKSPARTMSKAPPTFSSMPIDDLLSFIGDQTTDEEDNLFCVLINNIDGPALRDAETQQYLAQIAGCSHIRIIASIDHVNAPLLWNKQMVYTQFKWCWHHVPTYAPYKVEGMFYPLILASGMHAQTTRTALVVLQSLTPNAQSVFRVIAEYQLSHEKEEGMPISTLYTKCRERFLVSSQVTLNSHLTEFKDHDLVKTRRHAEATECLYIPLSSEAIEKLLQEMP